MWKKGQSGNPGGRPVIVNNVKEAARECTVEAVEALKAALKNPGERVPAATILLAYGYGRPVQNANVRVIRSVSDLSDEELLALADGDRDGAGEDTRH